LPAAVRVHDIDLEVAVPLAGEGDLRPVGRPRRVRVEDSTVRNLARLTARGPDDVDTPVQACVGQIAVGTGKARRRWTGTSKRSCSNQHENCRRKEESSGTIDWPQLHPTWHAAPAESTNGLLEAVKPSLDYEPLLVEYGALAVHRDDLGHELAESVRARCPPA
jgi:hypothetical protein